MPRVAARDRDAYVEARRSEILDAALRLWAERGFDATSVEAVANEAGLSKGTLYLYFPTKKALLDEVIRRRSLLPDVERLAGEFRDRPLADAVRLLVELMWRRLSEQTDVIRVLLRELPSHEEHARSFVERVVLPTNRLLAAFLEQKLGAERARELNALVAGRGLLGTVFVFFVTQRLLGGDELLPIPEEEIVGTITEVFLNGVLGPS